MKQTIRGWPLLGLLFAMAAAGALLAALLPGSPLLLALALLVPAALATWLLRERSAEPVSVPDAVEAAPTNTSRLDNAKLAHEIGNVVAVISGYLEAYDDNILTPTPAAISRLYGEARYLQRLVEDMRLLSHSADGRLQLECWPHDVDEILDAAERRLRQFGEPQAPIVHDVAAELPPIRVDAGRLAHAIAILLHLALQNSPEGEPVSLSARRAEHGVTISVSDQGEPIDESRLPTLFRTLHPRNSDRRPSGAGLGLALVGELVELHDGELTVSATPQTTITITLPAA